MEIYNTPFIENLRISFESIENIEIENPGLRLFYKSFFSFIHLPETAVKSFYTFLTSSPEKVS